MSPEIRSSSRTACPPARRRTPSALECAHQRGDAGGQRLVEGGEEAAVPGAVAGQDRWRPGRCRRDRRTARPAAAGGPRWRGRPGPGAGGRCGPSPGRDRAGRGRRTAGPDRRDPGPRRGRASAAEAGWAVWREAAATSFATRSGSATRAPTSDATARAADQRPRGPRHRQSPRHRSTQRPEGALARQGVRLGIRGVGARWLGTILFPTTCRHLQRGASPCPSPRPRCTTRCSTGPRSRASPTRPST